MRCSNFSVSPLITKNCLQNNDNSQPEESEVEQITGAELHTQFPYGERVWVHVKFLGSDTMEWFRPEAISCNELIKEYYGRVPLAPTDKTILKIIGRK